MSNAAPARGSVPTIGALVRLLTTELSAAGMSDANGEAREIVAAVLDVPRFWPAANEGEDADETLVHAALLAGRKRLRGAPLAYAVGRAPFRHLTLEVDERVLIPRVETELLVERLIERCDSAVRTVADIGTGSGAIAISLAVEGDFEDVIATDVSSGALDVARRNASLLSNVVRCPLQFRLGSVLAPLAAMRLDAIVSNPPYISYSESTTLPPAVRDWEPAIALLCADDGLAVTRKIIRHAPDVLSMGGILALEIDTRRAGSVAETLSVDGRYTEVEVLLDLTGRERFVFARRA